MARRQFVVELRCPDCDGTASAVWEENSELNPDGPQRRMVALIGDFHSEVGRTKSGGPFIVCNKCDAIQPR